MATVELPVPRMRLPDPPALDVAALERDLRHRVDGEVGFDPGSRAIYSTDASNYRQVPIGVVLPRTVDAAVEAVAVCREHGAPLLSRGGGTSLAGQTCNTAVVLDWSRHCRRVVSLDPERRTAVVEPGIVLDDLNRAAEPYGLMVGPKPSTHVSCTIGGMVGNNSCGSTAQAYGTMADSVQRLEILTYGGLRTWVGATDEEEYAAIVDAGGPRGELYARLRSLRDRHLALIRTRYPDLPRRVSGYNLDALLPERGFHVAQALVGSEGTLATVLHVELSLVPRPAAVTLVVLGFEDVFAAGDAVPGVAAHGPLALEGVDGKLVDLERGLAVEVAALAALPPGGAWLMVQMAGDSREEADERARALVDDVTGDATGDATGHGAREPSRPTSAVFDDPAMEEHFCRLREAGLGATAYPAGGPETHEGWEDAAVPPERLGDYLRDFSGLLERYGYGDASLYGHFGQGCVHTRIGFDLRTADGIAHYRSFVEEAADLVVSYGGSLSGEHGDGQSRGELLGRMFGDDVVRAFGELKTVFDPGDRMNPGKVVAPYRLDEHLRTGTSYRPWEPRTHFAYPADDFRFSEAAGRCVGVGDCRSAQGGVMCPSYRVTRDEKHSTRGRSRLLFEMVTGGVVTGGWRSREVREALDLCLACKGCKGDCPVSVDMATYKAEFLAHHYARRLRPRSHYSMGWLPVWARLAALAPRAVNAVGAAPGLRRLLRAAAGVTQRRELPRFAEERFTAWYARRDRSPARPPGHRGRVLLWPDTFSNNLHPSGARAAVDVLEAAGFEVAVPTRDACCGLTWISTGQLPTAKRVLRRTLSVLRDELRAGTPVVVLEPSCAAVFRSDLPDLLHGDEDAARLAGQTRTLAELLVERAPDWQPPQVDRAAVVQPHCHQHAVLGLEADRTLMAAAGVDADVLSLGCCGLAGNFGFERDHYDVSVACAEEQGIWPAVRAAPETSYVLADGFSCRTQIEHGTGRRAVHLAEALAAALPGRASLPS